MPLTFFEKLRDTFGLLLYSVMVCIAVPSSFCKLISVRFLMLRSLNFFTAYQQPSSRISWGQCSRSTFTCLLICLATGFPASILPFMRWFNRCSTKFSVAADIHGLFFSSLASGMFRAAA